MIVIVNVHGVPRPEAENFIHFDVIFPLEKLPKRVFYLGFWGQTARQSEFDPVNQTARQPEF